MKLINRYFIYVLFILVLGCNKQSVVKYWESSVKGEKQLLINNIHIDTFFVDGRHTSSVGHWHYFNNKFIWSDYLFSSFYLYDTNLVFKNRVLGKGNGPKEIPASIAACSFNSDRIFILGPSWDFYEVDTMWNVTRKSRFGFDPQGVPLSRLSNNPKSHYLGIYELNYSGINLNYWNSNYVILPIESTHPLFNGYISDKYYEEARILALLDLNESKIERIFGRYSTFYQKYKYIPQFSNVMFDVEGDNIIIGYEADSLIYAFKNLDTLSYKFGYCGREIGMKYPEVKSFDNYREIDAEHRPKYGFYKYIKCFPDMDILFRGYQKDGEQDQDGLQIYWQNNLMGDIDVPKGFRVFGFVQPYFYAEGIPDLLTQKLPLYRFNLKKLLN